MRRRTPAVTLTVALVLLAACSGGRKDEPGRSASPAPAPAPGATATTSTTLAPIAPLTGLPLTDQARLGRPALVVKIENAPASRPQSGLDVADVVYEEIVEGGITRFLAVFHSSDADVVGPVRSLRPSDPDIIAPFGGLFAYSGGIPNFIDILRKTPGITDVGVDLLDEGSDKPYSRRAGRTPPNNLYTATSKLYAKAPATGVGPPGRFAEFLPDGQSFSPPGATPATSLNATIGITSVAYTYDTRSSTYRRGGLVEGSGVAAPTNLIVQFTSYEETDETDLTNTTVEKAVTVGSGDAIVMVGGMAVRGRWSRPTATSFTTYTDGAGNPVTLAPGRTWVALARNGAPAVVR